MSTKPVAGGTIGATVRTLREMKGMSQGDLAKKANCYQPDVSALEHGRYNPSLQFLRRIAGALGVGLSVLLAESD